jgi:hypothetical protein
VHQVRGFNALGVLAPPYGWRTNWLIRLLKRS